MSTCTCHTAAPCVMHTYADEQAGAQQEGPVSLPYAGTSGHSGSDTSRERAERQDSTGTTADRQGQVLALLLLPPRIHGVTVKELREDLGWHHGQASSVLSCLHKDGKIARLTERRDRCLVYVLPEYVNGRETGSPGRTKANAETLNDRIVAAVDEYLNTNAFATAYGVKSVIRKERERG